MDVNTAVFRNGKVFRGKDLSECSGDHKIRTERLQGVHALWSADFLKLEHWNAVSLRQKFNRGRLRGFMPAYRTVRLCENGKFMSAVDQHLQGRNRKFRRAEKCNPHGSFLLLFSVIAQIILRWFLDQPQIGKPVQMIQLMLDSAGK